MGLIVCIFGAVMFKTTILALWDIVNPSGMVTTFVVEVRVTCCGLIIILGMNGT